MKFTSFLLTALGTAVVTNLVCNAISYFHTGNLSFSLYGWVCVAMATMALGGTQSQSDEESQEDTRVEARSWLTSRRP